MPGSLWSFLTGEMLGEKPRLAFSFWCKRNALLLKHSVEHASFLLTPCSSGRIVLPLTLMPEFLWIPPDKAFLLVSLCLTSGLCCRKTSAWICICSMWIYIFPSDVLSTFCSFYFLVAKQDVAVGGRNWWHNTDLRLRAMLVDEIVSHALAVGMGGGESCDSLSLYVASSKLWSLSVYVGLRVILGRVFPLTWFKLCQVPGFWGEEGRLCNCRVLKSSGRVSSEYENSITGSGTCWYITGFLATCRTPHSLSQTPGSLHAEAVVILTHIQQACKNSPVSNWNSLHQPLPVVLRYKPWRLHNVASQAGWGCLLGPTLCCSLFP